MAHRASSPADLYLVDPELRSRGHLQSDEERVRVQRQVVVPKRVVRLGCYERREWGFNPPVAAVDGIHEGFDGVSDVGVEHPTDATPPRLNGCVGLEVEADVRRG